MSKNSSLPIVDSANQSVSGRKLRPTTAQFRALVLILVHVTIVLHILHFVWYGRTISPVEPSESMYALERGHLNAGTLFFIMAISCTAIFGRFFCGWGCHIVALQDFCSYLLKRCGIRLKPLRSRLLAITPFVVAFYMFFWPTVQRLSTGIQHPGFTNHLMTEQFWKTFPGPVVSITTFLVCGGVVVYLLGNKGFCTYACPYGAFFKIADVVAIGRIHVNDACQHCGQCTAACTSNVQVAREVKDFGMVVDSGCMKCMDCVSACPSEALYFGFRPTIVPDTSAPTKSRIYDFSLAEDSMGLVIAFAMVYALRGLYDVVPFLLAVALAVITAFLIIQSARVLRRRDFRLQNLQIKKASNMTPIGYWVSAIVLLWLMFAVHSFYVQHNRYLGRQTLGQFDVAVDELFVFGPQEYSQPQQQQIDLAISRLEASDRWGFATVYDVKFGLAVASMMKNDTVNAEQFLRQAYQLNPALVRDLLIEFLGARGKLDEAEQIQ